MKYVLSSGKKIDLFIQHYHDPKYPNQSIISFTNKKKEITTVINNSTHIFIEDSVGRYYGGSVCHKYEKQFDKQQGRRAALKNLFKRNNCTFTKEERLEIWLLVLPRLAQKYDRKN